MALVARWKLYDNAANAVVAENNHNGVANANTNVLHAMGRIQRSCFDFDTQYAVEINDHADFTFGNGVADSPFSITAWIYVTNTAADQRIISKWQAGVDLEWILFISAEEKLALFLCDGANLAATPYIHTTNGLSVGWHRICATYDGTGGNDATSGMELYIDGEIVSGVDITRENHADYVAMNDSAIKVVIGASYAGGGALQEFYADKIYEVSLYNHELSAHEAYSDYMREFGERGHAMTKIVTGF